MNDLTHRLSELAGEMTDTDYTTLRTRVDAASRRLGVRRAATTSIAALAVVGVAVAGGLRLAPLSQETNNPAGTPSADATNPPAPTSTVTATSPATGTPVIDHVAGTLVYLRVGAEIEVVTVTDGVPHTTNFGPRRTGDGVAIAAPDATMVAVIRPTKPLSEYPGDLVIVTPGGSRRVVRNNVSWGGGANPVWTPDSRRLLVGVTTFTGDAATGQSVGYVDVASGQYSKLDSGVFPNYLSWSANGRYRAHATSNTKIVVSQADNTMVSQASIAGQPECTQTAQCPFGVQSVSDDGRYVATGHGNSDPTHTAQAHLVIDMQTGKRVPLPSTITNITEIFFRPDGGLLIQSQSRYYLTGGDGTLIADFARPDETNQADLVAYRP
jgi:hypothetical protein